MRRVLALSLFIATTAQADLPSRSYTPDQHFQLISPSMGADDHNQPAVVSGALLLAGNARHSLWDIEDPFRPVQLSYFESPYDDGEAESHSVSTMTDGENMFLVTISGFGVDLWDVTDPANPELLSSVILQGIAYGDNTEAVWGVSWQGDYIYVGGTNTGLHVVDATDPRDPRVIVRIPTSELGGVSAGPVYAIGNLLVTGTPKNFAGIATVDISNPAVPSLLDFVIEEQLSYIGAFYGPYAYLLTPMRTYDVTTDPSNIQLVASLETVKTEYISFGDHNLFLGALRPTPGSFKYDIRDPLNPVLMGMIEGRKDDLLGGALTDDQFSFPIGNLLVMSDDEIDIGSVLAVHDIRRDSSGPEVMYVNPPDGATRQPVTSRIGLSLSDHVDLASLDTESFIVRAVGGEPMTGKWGQVQTVISFWPDSPLQTNTTYEVVLPAGGITDLVGNPIPAEFRSVFSTGEDVAATRCAIGATTPVTIGTAVTLQADDAGLGATYAWEFGDGATELATTDRGATHVYEQAGRFAVTLHVLGEGGARTCTGIQIVHHPLTPERSRGSSTVIADASRSRIFTVNPDADTISAVDHVTREVLFETEIGAHPRTLAQADSGMLWVTSGDDDMVVLVDPDSGDIEDRIRLRYGGAPYGIAFAGSDALVTLEGTGELVRIDSATHEIISRLDLSEGSVRGIAVSGDGLKAWVTRFVSPESEGQVYEVDLTSMTARTIALAIDPGPDASDAGRGVPNYLSNISVSPDGRRAWVPSNKANTARGLVRDGLTPNTDNTVRTIVSQIDLTTSTEDLEGRIDIDDHDMAFAVTFSPLGDLVFVASQGTNQIDVFDTATGKLVAGFATGLAPQGLVLLDGTLYVQAFMSRSLSIFDVSGILDGSDAAARGLGDVRTIAVEPLAPDVLLGKQIFYNADSRQMSLDGYVACATCHLDGGHDGRTWDFTNRGEGLRNTTDLRGREGTRHGPVHWTANFDEIQDFENDIRFHFGGSGFIDEVAFDTQDYADPLGSPKQGLSESLDALAAYVSSLNRFPRSPFRTPEGELTDAARRGRALFDGLDCLQCHTGESLTDSGQADLHDVGTLSPTSGMRRGETLVGIDTPTLRGVWSGAPYFHDGSAATLLDVLEQTGHGNAQSLADSEKADLVAFLLSLDNEYLGLGPCRDCESGGTVGGACSSGGNGAGSLWLVVLLLLWRRPAGPDTSATSRN